MIIWPSLSCQYPWGASGSRLGGSCRGRSSQSLKKLILRMKAGLREASPGDGTTAQCAQLGPLAHSSTKTCPRPGRSIWQEQVGETSETQDKNSAGSH